MLLFIMKNTALQYIHRTPREQNINCMKTEYMLPNLTDTIKFSPIVPSQQMAHFVSYLQRLQSILIE